MALMLARIMTQIELGSGTAEVATSGPPSGTAHPGRASALNNRRTVSVMPIWSPLTDGKDTLRLIGKILRRVFRPPSRESSEEMIKEVGMEGDRQQKPPGS